MIGKTLGSYRIIEQIGIGGMATVFKAYAPDTDRYVAIKVLPHHFSHDPTFKERFQREAKAIAKLEHLHILPIYTYGEDDGVSYMVMRYLKAGTLTDRIKQGALPLDEAGHILSQIAGALDYAHSHEILHRDVKPGNILLDESGNAFLTDFGIAKMVESTLTGGDILGTPAYMSPEQCQGSTEITTASDLYSLGIVLYEMVTGRTPFQAETPIALIHMQLTEPLPLPRKLRPDLPSAAENVILKALSKDPKIRHKSCGAMALAFGEAVAGQPASVETPVPAVAPPSPSTSPHIEDETLLHQPPEKTTVVPPKTPSRRWMWPVVAVLVGIGVVAAGLLTLFFSRAEDETPQPQAITQAEEATPAAAENNDLPPKADFVLPPERKVEPCHWRGNESGLCIYSIGNDDVPIRLLEEAGLEIWNAPGWSPDGQQLIFIAREQGTENRTTLHTVNADGTNLTRLNTLGDWDEFPAWSPDGEWLAFSSGGKLALMQPESDEPPTIIADNEDGAICINAPEWSPDSNYIVLTAQMSGCEWEFPMHRQIWVVALNVDPPEFYPIADIVHEDEECVDFYVVFSPDGEQVAYIDEACHPRLINADGSGKAEAIADFPWGWLSNHYPQWQGKVEPAQPQPQPESEHLPDERIIDPCEWHGMGSGLCISLWAEDRVIHILEEANLEFIDAATWSPDGQYIIFSARETGTDQEFGLYVANSSGGELERLPAGEDALSPAWSPNDEWLAYRRYGCSLALMRLDRIETVTVVEDEAVCVHRTEWAPNGEQLVASVQTDSFDGGFPKTREIWLISGTAPSPEITPLIATHYARDTPEHCLDFAVAVSPDGRQAAYIDSDCQTYLVDTNGSGHVEPIDEFPWHWTARFYPQWP